AYVVASFGSIHLQWKDETGSHETPGGIAHFLEHQLFKKAAGDLTDVFSSRGAYCNAHTSHTQTAYYFECVRNFEENLDTLLELALTPYFDRKLVDTERDIIIQEINQYRDHPGWVGYQQLLASLYRKHPLRVDIAGTEEMVRAISPELLHRCHGAFYHPTNLTLIITGDLEPARVLKLAEELTQKHFMGAPAPRLQREIPREPEALAAARSERRMFVSRPRLLLGFKELDLPKGRELARRDLVTSIALDVLFGKDSADHERLYADGLISGDFGAGYQAESGFGYAIIGGETRDPAALQAEVAAILKRARKQGIAGEDVERKRRKFVGQYLRNFNDPETTAAAYLAALGQGSELFDFPALAEGITAKDINRRVQNFLNPSRMAASVILPQK
ncbi:MAG: insulinase family protein, partial [Planctomycetes bacterium]|nr:insulinase family protein [Planctomycetota bacterium]